MGPLNSKKLTAKLRPPGQYLKLSDCEIHYSVEGQGPAIVLIHGWGASKYCWRLLTPLLAKHYQIFEIDLPGFGRSTKLAHSRYGLDDQSRRILEFMDLISLPKAYLVGSSLGGTIALWMAAHNPERIRAVVAISPAASTKLMPLPIHRFSAFGRAVPRFMTNKIARRSLQQVLTKKELITNETLLEYLGPLLDDPDAMVTMIKSAEVFTDERLIQSLSKISPPVKILYGHGDKVIRRHHIDEALSYLPQETILKVHPTAGHHSQEDEPEWVYEEIQSFFS